MVASAPDYAEPLCGWRAWCLVEGEEGLQLRSVVYETFWPQGRPLLAECLVAGRGPHSVPSAGCRCGIYAASEPARAVHALEGYGRLVRGQRRVGSVLGRVFLWGDVVECAHGWRAGRAYPAHLYLLGGTGPRATENLDALAGYGVTVEPLEAGSRAETLAAIERAR